MSVTETDSLASPASPGSQSSPASPGYQSSPASPGSPAEPGALTIGQLSAETGVPTSTIRFWERKGLLAPDHRRSGQRRYTPSAVRGVAMLRLLQEVGLTLADIRRFREERAITPRSWHTLVAGKLADVERQIAALEHARDLLSHASTCHHDDLLACPGFQEWFAAYLSTFPSREGPNA